MDPNDGPMSRVGRTFWTFWNYLTETMNRLLRPEPPRSETNDTHAPQDTAINDDIKDDISQEEEDEVHSIPVSSVSSLLRPIVSWDSGSELQSEITHVIAEGEMDETGIDVVNLSSLTVENQEESSQMKETVEDVIPTFVNSSDEIANMSKESEQNSFTLEEMEVKQITDDRQNTNLVVEPVDVSKIDSRTVEKGQSEEHDGQIQNCNIHLVKEIETVIVKQKKVKSDGMEESAIVQSENNEKESEMKKEECETAEKHDENMPTENTECNVEDQDQDTALELCQEIVNLEIAKRNRSVAERAIKSNEEDEKHTDGQFDSLVLESGNMSSQQSGKSEIYENDKTRSDDMTVMQKNQGMEENFTLPFVEFSMSHENETDEQCSESEDGEDDNEINKEDIGIQEIHHENMSANIRKSFNEDENQENMEELSLNLEREVTDMDNDDLKLPTPLVLETENVSNQDDTDLFQLSDNGEHCIDEKTQSDDWTVMQRNQGMEERLTLPHAEFSMSDKSDRDEQCVESEDGEKKNEIKKEDAEIQGMHHENSTANIRKSFNEDDERDEISLDVEREITDMDKDNLKKLPTLLVMDTQSSEKESELVKEESETAERDENMTSRNDEMNESKKDNNEPLTLVLETENENNQDDAAIVQQSSNGAVMEGNYGMEENLTLPHNEFSISHESLRVEQCVGLEDGEKYDDVKKEDVEIPEIQLENLTTLNENQEGMEESFLNVEREVTDIDKDDLKKLPSGLVRDSENNEKESELKKKGFETPEKYDEYMTSNNEEIKKDKDELLTSLALGTESKDNLEDAALFQQSGNSEHYEDKKIQSEDRTVMERKHGMEEKLTLPQAEFSMSNESGKVEDSVESEDDKKDNEIKKEDTEILEIQLENLTANVRKSSNENQEGMEESFLNVEREETDMDKDDLKKVTTLLVMDTENNEKESELKKEGNETAERYDEYMTTINEETEKLVLETECKGKQEDAELFQQSGNAEHYEDEKIPSEDRTGMERNRAMFQAEFSMSHESEKVEESVESEDDEKDNEVKKEDIETPGMHYESMTTNIRKSFNEDEYQRNVEEISLNLEREMTDIDKDDLKLPIPLVMDTENKEKESELKKEESKTTEKHNENMTYSNEKMNEKDKNELLKSLDLETETKDNQDDAALFQQGVKSEHYGDEKTQSYESTASQRYQGMEEKLTHPHAEFSMLHDSEKVEQSVESEDDGKDNEIKKVNEDENQENKEQISINVERDITEMGKDDVMDAVTLTILDYQPVQYEHQKAQVTEDSSEPSEGEQEQRADDRNGGSADDGFEKISPLNEVILEEENVIEEESNNSTHKTVMEEYKRVVLDTVDHNDFEVSGEVVDSYMGKFCAPVIHEGRSTQEEGKAFKNIPLGECEGQESERLYSYKESGGEVPDHNNESDIGSATQRLLEGGNYMENQTTLLQEKVESGVSTCLQNAGSTGGDTFKDRMETEVVDVRSFGAKTQTLEEENIMKTVQDFERGFVLQEDMKEKGDLKEEMTEIRLEMGETLCDVNTAFTQKDFNDNAFQDFMFSIHDQSAFEIEGLFGTTERIVVEETEDLSMVEKEDLKRELNERICEIAQLDAADEGSGKLSNREEVPTSTLSAHYVSPNCPELCTDVIEDEILDLWIQQTSIQSSEDQVRGGSSLELPQGEKVESTAELYRACDVDTSIPTAESGFSDQSLDMRCSHNLETQELPKIDELMITCSKLRKPEEEQCEFSEAEPEDLLRKSPCSTSESTGDDADRSDISDAEESTSCPIAHGNCQPTVQTDDVPVQRKRTRIVHDSLHENKSTIFTPQEKTTLDALKETKGDEETHEVQVDVSELDFSPQKSRIAVKNPRARPPKDPRSLLHKPSLEPSPSKHVPSHVPAGVPMGALGIGIKLPGLGAGFPVLKKTKKTVEDKTEITSEETTPVRDDDESKREDPPQRPKWMPPNHPSFGNPLMSELKSKLKKTVKE